ncbi:protein LDOC1-like [Cynocephalus volans]|uniref:protein LDOC1-like n=1 Tax=Cynocephalus volans TaxID=110931 RepID=UPI002FC9978D
MTSDSSTSAALAPWASPSTPRSRRPCPPVPRPSLARGAAVHRQRGAREPPRTSGGPAAGWTHWPSWCRTSCALRREDNELMDQVHRLLCEKTNLLAQVRPPACPVAFPEAFNGDSAWLPDFLIQACSYMSFFQARFSNDTLKVAFLISRLTGAAEQWVIPYIERESPFLAQSEGFVDALKRAFGRTGYKKQLGRGAPCRGTAAPRSRASHSSNPVRYCVVLLHK